MSVIVSIRKTSGRRAARIGVLAAGLAVLFGASVALACPACSWSKPVKQKPGVASLDPTEVSRGFNISVFFMLATVYGVPGLLGLALWRTIRAHQSRRRPASARRSEFPSRAAAPADGSTVGEMNTIPVREEAGS